MRERRYTKDTSKSQDKIDDSGMVGKADADKPDNSSKGLIDADKANHLGITDVIEKEDNKINKIDKG